MDFNVELLYFFMGAFDFEVVVTESPICWRCPGLLANIFMHVTQQVKFRQEPIVDNLLPGESRCWRIEGQGKTVILL